jgi:hypothetical protein
MPSAYPQPGYGGAPMVVGTNVLAILSLVCAFLCSPLGLILGLVARSQIKRSGERGDGLAVAGIVLSILFIALTIIGFAAGAVSFHSTATTGP